MTGILFSQIFVQFPPIPRVVNDDLAKALPLDPRVARAIFAVQLVFSEIIQRVDVDFR